MSRVIISQTPRTADSAKVQGRATPPAAHVAQDRKRRPGEQVPVPGRVSAVVGVADEQDAEHTLAGPFAAAEELQRGWQLVE